MKRFLIVAAVVLVFGDTAAMAKPRPVPKTVLDALKDEPNRVPEFDISSVSSWSSSPVLIQQDGQMVIGEPDSWKQQKRNSPQMRRGLRGRT